MNKKLIAFAALVFAVVLTSFSVSGTYAKYTSEATATDKATVAKWDFKVGGTTLTKEQKTFAFDVFNTVNEDSLIELHKGKGEKIIAPGSKGTATIALKNDSQVKANVVLKLEEDGGPSNIPLKFKVKLGNKTFNDDYKSLENLASTLEESVAFADGTAQNLVIDWIWEYNAETDERTDENDTDLGLNPGTFNLKVTVTATQAAVETIGE